MLTVFLALICAFLWGYSEVKHKEASANYAILNYILYIYIFQVLAYLSFTLIFSSASFKRFDIRIYKFILPFVLVVFIANIIYNYCIKSDKVSLVSPILASDPVFVVIIGLLFLKEKHSILSVIAIVIICISIFSLNFIVKKDHKKTKKIALFLASVYAFLMAITATIEKSIYLAGYTIADMFFHYALLLIVLIITIYIYLKVKKNLKKPNGTLLKSVIATNIGNVIYSFLISSSYISLVVPITGLYSVVTQILAQTMLKEKLSIKQKVFVYLIIAATILLLI